MRGKWNWMDTTIIIVIVLAIVAFMNRGRLLQPMNDKVSNVERIIITIEADEMMEEMITNLNVGDQLYDQGDLQPAFVADVRSTPQRNSVVASDGTLVEVESLEEVNIEVDISAEVSKTGPYMALGEQGLKVGLPFLLRTTQVEFTSDIKHIEVN